MLTSTETSRFIALLSIKMITFAVDYRFRSSVGLEQQPSKLWVLGSNPNGITRGEEDIAKNKDITNWYSVFYLLLG